ncbi:hypothetical protein [Streptomyces sp. NPDC017964]|uniref:hypothetical protein n=1 Tax=Streptomyces sp. NPDC017964 TaxID=3365022 RepID=UPI0037936B4D
METLIALAVGAFLVALGLSLIHRLNAQHDARIAAYHFSDPFPAISRPPGRSNHRSTGQALSRGLTGAWP